METFFAWVFDLKIEDQEELSVRLSKTDISFQFRRWYDGDIAKEQGVRFTRQFYRDAVAADAFAKKTVIQLMNNVRSSAS